MDTVNMPDLTREDRTRVLTRSFAEKGTKVAIRELEELPLSEIKHFLQTTGAWDDIIRLSELVTNTLSFNGGEEFSRVLAVLEPIQLKDVVHASVMLVEDVVEINPLDYADEEKWIEVSPSRRDAILASGNKKLIDRLHNQHPMPHTREGQDKGPWAIYVDDKKILCNQAAGILSAIINAEREDSWKKEAIREIGLEMFAYSALRAPHILTMLAEFDQELYAVADKLAQSEDIYERALVRNADVVEPLSLAAAEISIADIPDGDNLAQMISDLRQFGNDVAGAIAEAHSADVAIEDIFREGIPEEE